MALLITESFDNGYTSDLLTISGAASINATGGVYNTGCGFIAGNANWGTSFIRVFCRSQSDFTVNEYLNYSFWFKSNRAPTALYNGTYNERAILAESYKDISWGAGIGFTLSGRVAIFSHYSDNWSYNHDISVLPSVCDGQWHFLEFNCRITTSTSGYVYAYQDGKLACYFVGRTEYSTLNTNYDGITFTNLREATVNYWIDDLTVWDEAGTNFVGYPKGPIRIQTLRPQSDISYSNSVSTGATNYEVLDEENILNTSDYVTISNIGNITLSMSNLNSDTTNVYGLITYLDICGIPGYAANVKLGNKINTQYSYQVDKFYTSSNNRMYNVTDYNFELNVPLTVANVNNLVVTVEKVNI